MSVSPTFLGLPNSADDDALGGVAPRIVLFGAGFGSAYPGSNDTGHALAADAIRAASQEDAPLIDHFDFDLGGPLFDGKPVSCIDIGNIKTTHHDNAGNRARIEAQTRQVLDQKAVPILLGGDCSVTIPFISAFAGRGPMWVLQIDAHIDWRDEVRGERYGYSSPMRRASEMPDVAGMVQVGLRSVGSARASDVNDALAYGSCFVTARDMQSQGV
jgi:agmatinase